MTVTNLYSVERAIENIMNFNMDLRVSELGGQFAKNVVCSSNMKYPFHLRRTATPDIVVITLG